MTVGCRDRGAWQEQPVHTTSPGGATPGTPRGHVRWQGEDAGYPQFHAAVALSQLTEWLPAGQQLLIDISGPGAHSAEVAAFAGHSVLRVVDQDAKVTAATAEEA